MEVTIAGVKFKNPVILASGCCGFGLSFEEFYPVEYLGGVSMKGITPHARNGNETPRVAECAAGMLNSVGLQNPGVEVFLQEELPKIALKDVVKIANVAGADLEEYGWMAQRLDTSAALDMIEVNISCPNVKEGGVAFGTTPEMAASVVKTMRSKTSKPLMVKLSPNVTDIVSIAKAVEDAGADAVSLINTLLGMRIDIKTGKPVLAMGAGGYSGTGVFPVALRMVYQVANSVKIPVVGLGGICSWQDAAQMLCAGAVAVQVGAELFRNVYAPLEIIDGLKTYQLPQNG